MQPSDLESAVHQQSWEWLFDLSRRLDIVVELIDARGVPLFQVAASAAAAELRRGLGESGAALATAITNTWRSTTPVSLRIARFQAVCFHVAPDGVILVAQKAPDEEFAAESGHDLEFIGTWLTGAVEASLANPPHTISEEPYRAASLRRILTDAAAAGSVRRVMGAFVEALGVWDSVRIRGYAAGANGGFFHFVSPIGALPSSVPVSLDDTSVPNNGRMVRLSREHADRLGFASEPGDVLTLALFTDAGPGWLLVFSGSISGAEQARLTFYADMLRESLDTVYDMTTKFVVAGMPQQHHGPNEPVDATVEAAVRQLAAMVGGDEAALVVTTVTGIRALAIGSLQLLTTAEHEPRTDRLVVTSSDTASVIAVVIPRQQRPFTAFEREVVQAAVAVLHPWIQAAIVPSSESERRRQFRPLESVFDQLAETVVGAGQDASVIVASVEPTAVTPAMLHSWLAAIRSQLRTGDFAGILSDNEIAVLLCDASADQAAVVSARIKHLIQTETADDTFAQPTFSATTRSPQLPFEGSLVQAARTGAAAMR